MRLLTAARCVSGVLRRGDEDRGLPRAVCKMMATAELAVLMTLREAYGDGSLRFRAKTLARPGAARRAVTYFNIILTPLGI